VRVLLVHGDLRAGGGAEAYALAVAATAAKLGHQVGWLDVTGHLPPDGRKQALLPAKLLQVSLQRLRFHLLKYAVVCQRVRAVAAGYSHVIYTYGEGPSTQKPLLRILHAPALFSGRPELVKYLGVTGGPLGKLMLRSVYSWACRRLARPDMRPGKGVTTVVNSNWTGGIVAKYFQLSSKTVLYPKVVPVPQCPDISRSPLRFITVGRLVPGKRLEDAVEIIAKLRDNGIPAYLQIVGRATGPYSRAFVAQYNPLSFVTITQNATRPQLARAMASARYGLHCYRHEHFGISVAEMITAGCLPFVFDGGGVVELVPDRRLRFDCVDSAVNKISALVDVSLQKQTALQRTLQSTSALKSAIHFDGQLENILNRFLTSAAA